MMNQTLLNKAPWTILTRSYLHFAVGRLFFAFLINTSGPYRAPFIALALCSRQRANLLD